MVGCEFASLSVNESKPARTRAAAPWTKSGSSRWLVTRKVGAAASDTSAIDSGAQERASATSAGCVCAAFPVTRL